MTMVAPEFFSTARAEEAQDVSAKAADAASRLRQMAKEGDVKAAPVPEGMRTFMSPIAPNSRFLAVKGEPQFSSTPTGVIGLRAMTERFGDVWVEFHQGVCSTDDPKCIAWLEAHSGYPDMHAAYHKFYKEDPSACNTPIGLCREAGPGIDVWAELVGGQHATSSRPQTISPSIDIDAFMRGELNKGRKSMSSGMGAMMEEAAANNEAARAERKDGQN